MSEEQAQLLLSALRALSPLLFAVLSLALVPLVKLRLFGRESEAAARSGGAAVLLLLLSSSAALLAGSGYASTLTVGRMTLDPSEAGRLLVALGGPVFALIVFVGKGRRAGTMGQVALFGLAVAGFSGVEFAIDLGDRLQAFAARIVGAFAASMCHDQQPLDPVSHKIGRAHV